MKDLEFELDHLKMNHDIEIGKKDEVIKSLEKQLKIASLKIESLAEAVKQAAEIIEDLDKEIGALKSEKGEG